MRAGPSNPIYDMQDLSSKYEIRQQIGKGSFGSAFLVTNKQDKRDYVLKRVRLAKQSKWQRNSTLQERDLVTTLQHPFIVPCVETWIVQGHTVNMIYGYCEKGDLASYLQRVQKARSQVDEGQMVKWLCQLLLALDYLQTKRVLHRDIKTSNLMLTCDLDVQIGDFGLATRMQDEGEGGRPQDTNLVGTPHYMSPELLSCKDYGFKTDVWSLGCVFYELTAQRPTFNAFNIHGLVSKIKKNKLAPLPDIYSSEWREVVGLMLLKNPDKRPSVQELMALPCLRPGMLQARQRAQLLMPDVQLPPLLDPTPYVFRGSVNDSQDADSDGSAIGSENGTFEVVDAVPVFRGYDCEDSNNESDSTWAASALEAQAVEESELSEVWRINSMQGNSDLHTAQQQQQHGQGRQLEQQQQQTMQETNTDWPVDTFSSRCSDSSRASSSSPGSLRAQPTPRSGLETTARRAVYQPGIKATKAERVAAAIAAARSSKAATADDQTASGCATAALGPASSSPDKTETSSIRDGGSVASSSTAATTPTTVQKDAAAALSARLAQYKERKQAAAAGGKPASRPSSAKGISSSSSRPAWNGGAAKHWQSPAAGLTRQPSNGGRAPGPASTIKAAAAAAVASAAKSKGAKPGLPKPQGNGHRSGGQYLQSFEDKRQQQQQLQGPEGSAADGVQQLLSTSQQLSTKLVELQQGLQQEQKAQPKQPKQRQVADTKQQQGHPQHPESSEAAACADSQASNDHESGECDSAVKQLHFGSTSPPPGGRTCVAPSSPTPVAAAAADPTSDAVTPGATTPNMFAAATAAVRGMTGARHSSVDTARAIDDAGESPVLWGNTASSSQPAPAASAAMQQTPMCDIPAHCSGSSPADSSQTLTPNGVAVASSDHTIQAARLPAVAAAELGVAERHRLELLESVMSLVGGLYARGRWQELGNVLCSAGVLPDSMHAAIQQAAQQGPPAASAASPAGPSSNLRSAGSHSSSYSQQCAASAAAEASQPQSALKLGDIVVLGRTRRVRGKIRYIGPVAWDASGENWVGMELESPCGMNGTQKGITYFDCAPKCATFHKASQLTSFDGGR